MNKANSLSHTHGFYIFFIYRALGMLTLVLLQKYLIADEELHLSAWGWPSTTHEPDVVYRCV